METLRNLFTSNQSALPMKAGTETCSCGWCAKSFERIKQGGQRQIYCSPECRRKMATNRKTKVAIQKRCDVCNGIFLAGQSNHRYCGQGCAHEAEYQKRRKPLDKIECKMCRHMFRPKRASNIFCSRVCCQKRVEKKRRRSPEQAAHRRAVDREYRRKIRAEILAWRKEKAARLAAAFARGVGNDSKRRDEAPV